MSLCGHVASVLSTRFGILQKNSDVWPEFFEPRKDILMRDSKREGVRQRLSVLL